MPRRVEIYPGHELRKGPAGFCYKVKFNSVNNVPKSTKEWGAVGLKLHPSRQKMSLRGELGGTYVLITGRIRCEGNVTS